MDPTMKTALATALLVVLAIGALLGAAGAGVAEANPSLSAATTVVGNITGPALVGYTSSHEYTLQATGGPAFNPNGTQVGNLTYYASVAGQNLTGVTVSPSTGTFVNGKPQTTQLGVGNVSETLTIAVEISSVYQHSNKSINLTYAVTVVQPYVLTLHLLAGPTVAIASFNLTVDLDGTPVGSILVPALTPKEAYVATFSYPTLGLGAGEHTFTVSLANEHGLVTFPGGATTYSTSFYVAGPAPNYTIWYLAGAVAFFGAIFIFVTRVAARRRSPTRK